MRKCGDRNRISLYACHRRYDDYDTTADRTTGIVEENSHRMRVYLFEIDLMLDRFHTLIDIYCDRREEFPVGFDEFMSDLERSTKILTEMKDIAKSKISESSDG